MNETFISYKHDHLMREVKIVKMSELFSKIDLLSLKILSLHEVDVPTLPGWNCRPLFSRSRSQLSCSKRCTERIF